MIQVFDKDILTVAPFIWILLVLGASLLYRRTRGKPIFFDRPAAVRFRQSGASGTSHRSWFTRLGGASNCLVVQVTDEELDIHPFVPFNWFFLPEIYGLEHRIPLGHILAAKIVKKLFGRRVELEFSGKDGGIEKVSLVLKKPEEFLAAIGMLSGTDDGQFARRDGVITAKPIEPGGWR